MTNAADLAPVGVRYCPQGDHYYSGSVCPRACRKASEPVAAMPDGERPAARRAPSKPRPGAAAEAMLRAQLKEAGYVLWVDYIAEWAWGILLDPPRLFRADAGFYRQDLCVEIVGGSHAAGRKKVRADVERQGLAATLGLKVLTVTPEQVRDGTAMRLLEEALAAGELDPREEKQA